MAGNPVVAEVSELIFSQTLRLLADFVGIDRGTIPKESWLLECELHIPTRRPAYRKGPRCSAKK